MYRWAAGGRPGDGAEVPLPVDEPVAQVPVLGHPHQRVVDRRVAVRVVPLHRLADDAGALAGGGGRPEAEVVHRDEDAPLRRLQPVAHVRQRPADDDRLGVGEVAVAEFVDDVEIVDRAPPGGPASSGQSGEVSRRPTAAPVVNCGSTARKRAYRRLE